MPEAFLTTPRSLALAGAGGLGVVATWFLPSTLEDFLALALAGAVGYASILNLPLRRREAKDRLDAVSAKFIQVRPVPALPISFMQPRAIYGAHAICQSWLVTCMDGVALEWLTAVERMRLPHHPRALPMQDIQDKLREELEQGVGVRRSRHRVILLRLVACHQ